MSPAASGEQLAKDQQLVTNQFHCLVSDIYYSGGRKFGCANTFGVLSTLQNFELWIVYTEVFGGLLQRQKKEILNQLRSLFNAQEFYPKNSQRKINLLVEKVLSREDLSPDFGGEVHEKSLLQTVY